MANLYFVGTAGSGKTAVILGLALQLKEQGVRVGYFKPVGIPPGAVGTEDRDAVLMREVLDLNIEVQEISPLALGGYYISVYKDPDRCRQRVRESYAKVKAATDGVLIDGAARPWGMAAFNLDAVSLAQELGAALVYVLRPVNDRSLDEAVFFARCAREQKAGFAGVLFNNVPRALLAKTEGIYREILAGNGIETLGIVPSRPELSAPTVAEYYETLGGEILTGEDRLGKMVEDVLVGAMTIESALGYFRRSANKAVVTGGDRSEIALAALETDTAVLILSGGLYPDVKVLAKAAEKGVPVILVHFDTYTTVEKLAEVSRIIHPDDKEAIALARENMARHCNVDKLAALLRD
ncbi:MAG TPA: phosphotransacetylase family protein [Desulfotomaculum sp.]|nr:phosphotransacetylase family protein [Desulfotomaculum sp.]